MYEEEYILGGSYDEEWNVGVNAAYKRVRVKDPQDEKTEKEEEKLGKEYNFYS